MESKSKCLTDTPDLVKRHLQLIVVLGLIAAGAVMFLTGLDWGLPSKKVDRYLFGAHPVWSGSQIVALAGNASDAEHAVDVSSVRLDRRQAIVVNATDEQRARIVRRYRLMSYQPDEFATFASLGQMSPSRHQLDPKMYKYGGLWIYPVGALLKLASMAGWVELKPDMTWYLDWPEAFGKFYVVARFYSALWGLAGVVVVFLIVRKMTGSMMTAAAGGLCFLLMPVVVNAAHEAKPHLAGAVLMLMAVLAAARYAEMGGRQAWLLASLLCGAAIGMVPSSIPVVLVLPAMECLRRENAPTPSRLSRVARVAGALTIAVIVFLVTNPYIPINLIYHRAVLQSHFGNASGFYNASWAGTPNALLLIGLGTSFGLTVAGLLSVLALAATAVTGRRKSGSQADPGGTIGILLAVVSLAVALQFIVFAANLSAEYARFALLFDIFLAIMAVVAAERFVRPRAAYVALLAVLVLTTAWSGGVQLRAFVRDTVPETTRMQAASRINELASEGGQVLATRVEPAPGSLPPVDLWRWTVVAAPSNLQPNTPLPGAQTTVGPIDVAPGTQPVIVRLLQSTPISWASKPFGLQTTDHP